MQREQFENRVKCLLPEATDEAMAAWTAYVDELSRDDVEPEAELYDESYVELTLIKQHCGEEIATQLFNYGTQFTFNYFELRGAASKLVNGWTLEDIEKDTIENGCDATPEEYREFLEALQAFQMSASSCAEKEPKMENKQAADEKEVETLKKERKHKRKERGEAR